MTQRVDISEYFTRRQSDQRYLRRPQTPQPPASLALVDTGVVSTGTDQYAFVDVTIVPPATPSWATNVPQYVQAFEVAYSYVQGSVTVQRSRIYTYASSNTYKIEPVPTGVSLTITAQLIDYTGQKSAPSSALVTSSASDTIPPAQPTITAAPYQAGTMVVITAVGGVSNIINTEPDFAKYELWRGTGPDIGHITWDTNPLFSFFGSGATDISIPATANYFYKVAAVDFSNNRQYSDPAGPVYLLTTNLTPPAAVNLAGATVIPNPDASVLFNWHPSTDTNLGSYRVWRKLRISTGPDVYESSWTLLDQITASPGTPDPVSYTDASAISGQHYKWAVTAVNTVGDESAFPSSPDGVDATALDSSAPSAVSAISITGRVGGVLVTWTRSTSPDVTNYLLNWRLSPSSGWQSQDIGVDGNSYSILGLTTSRDLLANQFEVRVISQDGDGNQSSPTSYVALFPDLAGYRPADDTVPASPASLTPTIGNDGTVTLLWPASVSSDRTSYQVEKFDSIDAKWEVITVLGNDASGNLTYRVVGLEPFTYRGKQYRFRVRTIDNSGNLSAVNQAENASLEAGAFTSWLSAGNAGAVATVAASNPRTGTYSLKSNYAARPYQDVVVSELQFYTLSAYLREDPSSTGHSARIRITWLKADHVTPSGLSVASSLVVSNSSYQRLTASGQAPTGTVYARIQLEGDASNTAQTVLWDDIQFEQGAAATLYADAKTDLLHAADITPPADYAGLNLTAVGGLGAIGLRWVNPDSTYFDYVGSTFEVWRANDNGFTVSVNKIGEVQGTNDGRPNSYDDLDPTETAASTYYYRLKARDRFKNVSGYLNGGVSVAGTSLTPNDVSIVTIDTTPPTQPDITTATITAQDDGSIKLVWNNQTTIDLAGYIIYRRRSGVGESFVPVANIAMTPAVGTVAFVDVNLVLLQTYDYSVAAYDRQQNTSTFDTVTFKTAQSTDTRTPAVPSNLLAKGGLASIRCTWDPSATVGVREYGFQFSVDNGSSWSTLEYVSSTQKTVPFTNNDDLSLFLFRVESFSASRSANSAFVTLTAGNRDLTGYIKLDTTAPSAPASLTPSLNDNSEVILTWPESASIDINRYLLESAYKVGMSVVARATNVVTGTTLFPHGLSVGDAITIADVVDTGFNGTFTVASVPTSTTLTWAQTAADTSSTLGSVQGPWKFLAMVNKGTLIQRVTGYQPYLLGGKLFSFRIWSIDNSNLTSATAAQSAFVQVRLDTQPPAIPTGLTGTLVNFAASTEPATANLGWQANSDIDLMGYELSYIRHDGNGVETIIFGPSPSCSITGLRKAVQYDFKVRAIDRSQNRSDWSAIISLTSVDPGGSTPSNADCAGSYDATLDDCVLHAYNVGTVVTYTKPGDFSYFSWKRSPKLSVTAATRTTNVVTVTTSTPHGLVTGQNILLAGMTVSSFNGQFVIASTPTTTTLTFSQTAANSAVGNTGRLGYEGSQVGTSTTEPYTDTSAAATSVQQYLYYAVRILSTTGQVSGLGAISEVSIPAIGSGGGGTGGGGSRGCPAVDQFVDEELLAGDSSPADSLTCIDVATDQTFRHSPEWTGIKRNVRCFRLLAPNGAELVVSWDTPLTVKDGSCVWAEDGNGVIIPTDVGQGIEWLPVKVEYVGLRDVVRIFLGGKVFRAGARPGKWIYTHNVSPDQK
jgi:hypothetical protein